MLIGLLKIYFRLKNLKTKGTKVEALSNLYQPQRLDYKRQLVETRSEKTPKKSFKDDASGFIHFDIKSLLRIPDEWSRCYLFVAIDSAPP